MQWAEEPAAAGDPEIGDAFGGGYYFGKIKYDDGSIYWLVLADKSTERNINLYGSGVQILQNSTVDGYANTYENINTQQRPAAAYCAAYRGGGFSDWYLWAIYEMELACRNLRPIAFNNNATNPSPNPYSVPPGVAYTSSTPGQTSVPIFRSGGAQAIYTTSDSSSFFGSSTVISNRDQRQVRFYDNIMFNIDGGQSTPRWVRPIRRVLAVA